MLLVGIQNGLEVSNEELFAEQMPDPSVSHYLAAVNLCARQTTKLLFENSLQIPLCRWQRALAEPKPRVRTGSCWY